VLEQAAVTPCPDDEEEKAYLDGLHFGLIEVCLV
jgi:hypothetical protein